jgi:DNA-binding SARP family transcriptional activator
MQTNDLLEAAQLACMAYWDGSDKSKLNLRECMSDLRECMSDLRVCVEAEMKKRAKDATVRLEKSRE